MFDKLNVYSSNIAIIDENLETFTYKDLLISSDELGKKQQNVQRYFDLKK
jgi:hypothetical protein